MELEWFYITSQICPYMQVAFGLETWITLLGTKGIELERTILLKK